MYFPLGRDVRVVSILSPSGDGGKALSGRLDLPAATGGGTGRGNIMTLRSKTASSVIAAVFVCTAVLSAASPAAADSGGNGNPAIACPNAQPVASANITTSTGGVVGKVELR
ncbi:hypothetical protein ACFYPN_22025 [Streptomyces sp. NPDC005576]|uniref:hypothetical protein n=1 Tax=Streptomyces sp. NPDC005576 TaxID=3364726 RepID=UPI003677D68F